MTTVLAWILLAVPQSDHEKVANNDGKGIPGTLDLPEGWHFLPDPGPEPTTDRSESRCVPSAPREAVP